MADIYKQKYRFKIALLFVAISIGVISQFYTNSLVKELRVQEREKVELWAEANRQVTTNPDLESDISFLFQVINNNKTVPAILTSESGRINGSRNLDTSKINNPGYLQREIEIMKEEHDPIVIEFDGGTNYIYYRDSFLLKRLQYYPFIMLSAISIYLLISYLVFSSARKAEQNRVWVGMAKETAHQIGTPLSSLLGWTEILKSENTPQYILDEILKDINRLQTITERFSKIGSIPAISPHNLIRVTEKAMLYIKDRSSKKITFSFVSTQDELQVPLNIPLYEWVIENILRNALDAMDGNGKIGIDIQSSGKDFVIIDITDSGKGIKKSQHKSVFQPGFTTKSRGWGLGLSLAKRIIEEYHKGQIIVLSSDQGKGTTFRVKLKTT